MDVRPERPEDRPPFTISDDLWCLAEACWAKAPQDRPTALMACDRIAGILLASPISGSFSTSETSGASANGGVGDEGPPTSHIHHAEVSGDSSQTSSSDNSRRPTEAESTRPTTAGSGFRSAHHIDVGLDGPEQSDKGTSEPRSMGINNAGRALLSPPPSPTDVRQRPPAGRTSRTAQNASVGSPTNTRPPTRDSTYSSDSVAENGQNVAGTSSGNASSNAPRPFSMASSTSTMQSGGESVTDNQSLLSRIANSFGKSASKTRTRPLSPVRETSGFRIPQPNNVRSLATELWSLEDLLDRWIGRSSGKSS
jgi:hypothetical protein